MRGMFEILEVYNTNEAFHFYDVTGIFCLFMKGCLWAAFFMWVEILVCKLFDDSNIFFTNNTFI